MPSLRVTLSAFLLATIVGCGASPASDPRHVEPSLDYAIFVHTQVMGLKRPEAGLKLAVDNFAENLEGYEKKPLGTHKEAIEGIAAFAKELKQMKDRNASDAELKKKIDEIIKLADKLPSPPAEQK
jgi:hypothetical protein